MGALTGLLTAERLIELDACESGIEVFTELFPEGLDVSDWTPEKQIGVLMHRKLRRYWGWAVRSGIIPSHSMQGWDLRWADLREADLRDADLRDADLSYSWITWATKLEGAQLEGTRCYGVSPRDMTWRWT